MIVDNEKSWSELNQITSHSLRFQLVISVPVVQDKVRATVCTATNLQLRVTLKDWDGPGDEASARSGMIFFLDSTRLGNYRPFLPPLDLKGPGYEARKVI